MKDVKNEALKKVLDFVERWNKQDKEPEVAEAARLLEEELEKLETNKKGENERKRN